MGESHVYAGIDIGGTSIKYGLVDRSGKVLYKEHRPTLVEKGAEPVLHLVTNIAEHLLMVAAEDDFEVKWLGVGTPGTVDSRTGKVIGLSPNIDGWQGMEIGRTLSDRLNMPVFVDNDVNAMALAEQRFGAATGYSSAICVALGTGVGGAVILDGKLRRGPGYSAGEIGHMSINPDGPPCRCGAKGCIEAYCSSSVIVGKAKAALANDLSPAFEEVLDGSLDNINIRKIFAAVKKGDSLAQSIIDETAELLSIGLAGAVNLLNPDIVIIGGGIADGGGGFVQAVSAGIRKRAFAAATDNLRVTRATLGNNAGFIGAGILGEVIT